LAEKSGRAVVGIHNDTEGILMDLFRCLQEKLDRDKKPAMRSILSMLLGALPQGNPVLLIGHSQGALIIARALEEYRHQRLAAGISEAAVRQELSLVRMESFGGAAADYVDGPSYLHHVNRLDPVALFFGVAMGWAPWVHRGQGSSTDAFFRLRLPKDMPPPAAGLSQFIARFVDRTVHGPQDIYWSRAAALDQIHSAL
jgi:hypothetical protein